MAGYIGKISAIVTANTSDFSRKMQGLPKDVERFSRSLQSSLNSASSSAQKSLEKIFTPLQQLERKLKTASDRGLNLKLPVDQIRAFVSVAEGVNKPIERLAGGFTKLSAEVQAEFLPALNRVQSQAVTLGLALERNGTVSERSFDIVIRKIEETELAFARLGQAQQIAARGLTGRELQFVSPSVFQSLNRTADLTQRAGGLPTDRLADGGIAAKVQQLDRAGQKLQVRFAELETLRLTPNVDSSLIEAAERRVNRLVTFIKAAQDNLETLVSDPPAPPDLGFRDGDPTGVFGPQRPDDSAALIARERAQRNAELARETLAGSRFASQFGGGSGGLKGLFDQQALRGYSAQLQVLQGVLGNVSAEARGPASTAFLRLRDAIADAMDRGEIETEQTRNSLRRLTQEAATATARVAGVSSGSIQRKLERVGDVARGSFGNAGLAIQQAAFAFDDFFSVTGGLDQRIRAAGNNISQLGFILGGTAGLIAGVAASVGSQIVVALIKWRNAGIETQDSVKALNDAMSRQKQLAGELSSALAGLSEGLAGDVFSDALKGAEKLNDLLENLDKTLRKIKDERIILNPEVQNLRAQGNRIERQLQNEADPGVRLVLERQLAQIRGQERQAIQDQPPAIGFDQGLRQFRRALFNLEFERPGETVGSVFSGLAGFDSPNINTARQSIESLIQRANVSDTAGLRGLIRSRIDETSQLVNTSEGVGRLFSGRLSEAASAEVEQLNSLLNSLEDFDAASLALTSLASGVNKITTDLSTARKSVEEFGDGLDLAKTFSDKIDTAGRVVTTAFGGVQDAVASFTDGQITIDQLQEAIVEAKNTIKKENDLRAGLVREIESTFNKEVQTRRNEILEGAQNAIDRREQSAARGRELALTPEQRRARDIEQSILDIQNAFGPRTPQNLEQALPAVQRFIDEQARQIAPAVFALRDQVDNAVLQGPSRAALTASDITTQAGTAELNRLLRGDDSARDQNLLELRKQTAELVGLREDFKQLGVAP